MEFHSRVRAFTQMCIRDRYYIVWDEDLTFVIADIVGVSEGAVKEVLIKALQVGFFDNTLYEKYHVLTLSLIHI